MQAWNPDPMVTESVIDGRRDYYNLGVEDRRWVVADLTHRGYSAARIGEWLGCSMRQVKRLRAELVTQVMMALVDQVREAEAAHRSAAALRSEVRRLREEFSHHELQPMQ